MVYINLAKIHNFEFDELKLSKRVIKEVLSTEKINVDVSVNISIVSKYKIKKLNFITRKINKVTDVLSFPNIDFKRPSNINQIICDNKKYISVYDFSNNSLFLGDIVICYDRVISQSRRYGHSIIREYSFLITHSMLHLLGYDHIIKKDEIKMFNKQDIVLKKLKITK